MGTVNTLTLDLQRNIYQFVRVAQYDENSRTIIIKVTDNGKPYPINTTSITPHIKYLKNDGKKVVDDTSQGTLSVLNDGTLKLVLSAQMCAVFGQNEAELMLLDTVSKEVIHTCHFFVNIGKSVFQNNEVTSSDEFQSFEHALVRTEEMADRLEYILENLKPITKSQIDAMFS